MGARIEVDREKIADFCQRHHIQRLAFFGSVLGENFGPDSDVDVLVEFDEGHVPGLEFFAMEAELSAILGIRAELHTRNFLSPRFRQQVEEEAQVQYARA